MTRSGQIIEAVRREIREACLTITDPTEIKDWANERGITPASISAASGADATACVEKFRAGSRYQSGHPEYDKYALPLTPENFPGRAGTWREDGPTSYILKRVSDALDGLPIAVDDLLAFDAMYRMVFGTDRAIDAPGFAFWWSKHLIENISLDDIEMHLRASPEAQDL